MKRNLLFFVCLALLSCSEKAQENTLESELNKLLAEQFPDDKPGASVLLKKGSETIFMRSYGLADLETGEKITENTVFNTGSVSKTFVSNGILILKERGLLSLDDNLNKYFDDFDNKELAEKVTIRHMLSHTSGLPDLRRTWENREFYLTARDTANFEPLKRAEQLYFDPGQKFQYSNPAYNGLALIIEKVTKRPWQEFIVENIFEPSGMTNSKITQGAYPESGVAHGYANVYSQGDSTYYGDYYELDYGEVPTFAAAGNGGVWSSAMDLARYEEALRDAKFLSKEMIKESRSVFHPKNWSDTLSPVVGYSWFIGESRLFREKPDYGVNFISHTGLQGGFWSFYIAIPEKDIVFVGLFNRSPDDFWDLIARSMELLNKNDWLDSP